MALNFGTQPSDVVQDQQGNALANVHLDIYPSRANAVAETSAITSLTNLAGTALGTPYVVTDSLGRFEFRVSGDPYDKVFVRTPSDQIWELVSSDVDVTKADLDPTTGKVIDSQTRGPKYWGTVASQAAMIAFGSGTDRPITGDWCIRSDVGVNGTRFDLTGTTYSTAAHWLQNPQGAAPTDEFLQDFIAAMFTTGVTHTNLTATYDDTTGKIALDADIDPTDAYVQGLIDTGQTFELWWNPTTSTWPTRSVAVPAAYLATGRGVRWNSPFWVAAPQPPTMANLDRWKRRVIS